MKTIFFLLVLFFVVQKNISQTKLDSLVMVEVNLYRSSKGLGILTVNKVLKPLVDQHLKYMVETTTVPLDHSQLLTTKYPKKFKNFTERCDYILKKDFIYVGELCVATLVDGDLEYMAKKIVRLWISSPTHHEALLKGYIQGFYVKTSKSNKLTVNGSSVFEGDYIYCTLNTIVE